MAITYVGASSSSSAVYYVGTALPTGTQNGDFALMFVRSGGRAIIDQGAGLVPTDGVVGGAWTPVLANTARGGNDNLHVFCGIAEVGGPALPNVFFTDNGNHQMTILTFRGVDPVAPFDVMNTGYAASTITHIAPSVSPTYRPRDVGGLLVHAVTTQLVSGTAGCTWSAAGIIELSDTRSTAGYNYLSTATTPMPTSSGSSAAVAQYPTASWGLTATIVLVAKEIPGDRLRLGSARVPLMLGNTMLPIEPSVPARSPSGGSGGVMADEMGRWYTAPENNYASRYHRWIGHLTTSKPIGLLVHLHGDGAAEYNNPTSTWMLGGAGGIVQVAKDKNMLVICPLTPDDTNVTWWHWYGKEENSRWLVSLIQALCGAYNIDTRRVWFTAYSGGAQFLTKYFLPRFTDWIGGGGAIMFGGGDENATTLTPPAEALKSRFPMHWLTGLLDDGTEPGSDGFNALAAARRGEKWYREQGFVTTLNIPAGQGHDWNGTYGTRVKAILDANNV